MAFKNTWFYNAVHFMVCSLILMLILGFGACMCINLTKPDSIKTVQDLRIKP